MAQAVILALWRQSRDGLFEESQVYKKLSAVELVKLLPMKDESTARRNLKALLKAGVLVQHSKHPKLYRLASNTRPAMKDSLHLLQEEVSVHVSVDSPQEEPERPWIPAFKRSGSIIGQLNSAKAA
jgi:hypothetical protein